MTDPGIEPRPTISASSTPQTALGTLVVNDPYAIEILDIHCHRYYCSISSQPQLVALQVDKLPPTLATPHPPWHTATHILAFFHPTHGEWSSTIHPMILR